MSQESEGNNGLYFIVGALVVAVAVIGFLFMGNNAPMESSNPVAGIESAVEKTSNSFNIKVDEDGVSGSSTSTDSN